MPAVIIPRPTEPLEREEASFDCVEAPVWEDAADPEVLVWLPDAALPLVDEADEE